MKIAAVIAEYNPFHNGHAYQLKEIRRQTGADFIIVMMSGDFVQRGAPACIDKYTRCKMALAAGADMVCELPVYGAVGSAEIFAESAVFLLNHFGCIDFLCFGVETIAPELLNAIVQILVDEPDNYRRLLQRELKAGKNFPSARSRALCVCLKNPDCERIINQPNNILAIEYMKALHRSKSTIQPIMIQRTGGAYHSTETTTGFASASAIRHQLYTAFTDPASIVGQLDIPDSAKVILTTYLQSRPILTRDDFSDLLAFRLLDPTLNLTDYVDMNRDLAHRIDRHRYQLVTTDTFIDHLSARNLTSARIARCLFHVLLNLTNSQFNPWRAHQYLGYLRVLGFRKSAGALWQQIDPAFRPQMVTRTAQAQQNLSANGLAMYEAELYASRLYRQVLKSRSRQPLPDITSEPVIIRP